MNLGNDIWFHCICAYLTYTETGETLEIYFKQNKITLPIPTIFKDVCYRVEPHGTYRYIVDKKVVARAEFEDGLLDGSYFERNASGIIEGKFFKGLKHGQWTFYNNSRNSNFSKIIMYNRGVLIYGEEFFPQQCGALLNNGIKKQE